MTELAPCPICRSPYTYELESLLVCPECGHKWNAVEEPAVDEAFAVKDSNGNALQNGDTVITIKNLPVKGTNANHQSRHKGQKHPFGRQR